MDNQIGMEILKCLKDVKEELQGIHSTLKSIAKHNSELHSTEDLEARFIHAFKSTGV